MTRFTGVIADIAQIAPSAGERKITCRHMPDGSLVQCIVTDTATGQDWSLPVISAVVALDHLGNKDSSQKVIAIFMHASEFEAVDVVEELRQP